MVYENPWLLNGEPFDTEHIDKYVGFVYLILDKTNGFKYIGRKYFYSIRKVKGKRNRQKIESDWKLYYGSSKDLLTLVEERGIINFERHILSLHITRGDVNYEEVKQQFLYNVLEEDGWYNGNISGKWMKKPRHIMEARKYNVRIFR